METELVGKPGAVNATEDPVRGRAYALISRRLLPFLFLCFYFNYLDRINVGFAKLQMSSDIYLSDYAYGLGAGVFFIGYVAFEVPSNLMLHRVGARFWIARIMITWGIISVLHAFVQTPTQFYILRFLLGVAEAGFAPGILLYLTYWFPASRRARAFSLFLVAGPISGALGAPLSGWIIDASHGVASWQGWRWMFLIEGLPAIILGLFCFWILPNRPAAASWLTRVEKEVVMQDLAHEELVTGGHLSIRQFLADRRLWLLCVLYFAIIVGHYTVSFWLPTMVQSTGISDPLQNGLLTSLPFAAAAITMVVLGRSADRSRKRRRHVLIPMVVGSVALALSPLAGSNLVLSMALLCIATAGLMSATAMFWSIPPLLLSGVWAAAGIAAINSIGNIAGFVSPFVMGWILEETNSLQAGLNTMAAIVLLGVLLLTLLPARQVDR